MVFWGGGYPRDGGACFLTQALFVLLSSLAGGLCLGGLFCFLPVSWQAGSGVKIQKLSEL